MSQFTSPSGHKIEPGCRVVILAEGKLVQGKTGVVTKIRDNEAYPISVNVSGIDYRKDWVPPTNWYFKPDELEVIR